MICRRVFFEGKVQGVGFRYSTKRLAMGFDVAGWVENLSDGRVRLEVCGEAEEVESFLEEIQDSELGGLIRDMQIEEIEVDGNRSGFEIRR